jgi:hypothetical protein
VCNIDLGCRTYPFTGKVIIVTIKRPVIAAVDEEKDAAILFGEIA